MKDFFLEVVGGLAALLTLVYLGLGAWKLGGMIQSSAQNNAYDKCVASVNDPRFCWESIYQGSNAVTDYAQCDTVKVVSSNEL